MAQAAVQGTAEAGGQPQEKASFIGIVIRCFVFYYAMSALILSGKKSKNTTSQEVELNNQPQIFRPLFQSGDLVDMWVYITESSEFDSFDEEFLVWCEEGIALGEEVVPPLEKHIEYIPSPAVQNNGTVFAHIYFSRTGTSPIPSDPDYRPESSFSAKHPLIEYRKRPKVHNRKNLLAAVEDKEEAAVVEQVTPDEIISYWKPNMTINVVDDYNRYPRNGIPPQVLSELVFEADTGMYYPVVYMNDFWLLREKLIPVNSSLPALNLTVHLAPISLMYWQMQVSMANNFKSQVELGSLSSDAESDEFKRVLLEGNPYLLAITCAVSLLHTVFDFFAFKNDVSFWRKNKSMEGLSMRTIMINACSQLVIFFYLMDNETSWMVLLSSGVGTCIEFWKVTKACKVSVDRSGSFPKLKIENRESYEKSKTREYDEIASRYLAYVLYPLILCYAVYSLYYNEHKSWYSFVLTTLVGCVYTFGFITMCPQLYINYRLKSVAHMPWRQMTYKFLNTIIDDLFAFVIKMPTLHRLSVFRDDIIFLIYLYQRYAYRVDMKRVNEYGFGGEDATPEIEGEKKEEKSEVDHVLMSKSEKIESDISARIASEIGISSAVKKQTTTKRKTGKKQ